MPWWSWIVIWALMGLLLVGTLAGLGIVLFRTVMRTADALDDVGRQLAAVTDTGRPTATLPSFTPAVFQDRDVLHLATELQASDRRHRKQVRRDGLIAQGKLFSHAQMIQRTEPHAR